MYSINQIEINSQPHTLKVISGRKGEERSCVKLLQVHTGIAELENQS